MLIRLGLVTYVMLSLHLIYFDFSQSCLIVLSVEPFTFFSLLGFYCSQPVSETRIREATYRKRQANIFVYILIYTYIHIYVILLSIYWKSSIYTIISNSSPVPQSSFWFISVSYNFLSSVRNLSLFSLIISTYSINPAFLTLAGLQCLKPDHCHYGDIVSLLGLWHSAPSHVSSHSSVKASPCGMVYYYPYPHFTQPPAWCLSCLTACSFWGFGTE